MALDLSGERPCFAWHSKHACSSHAGGKLSSDHAKTFCSEGIESVVGKENLGSDVMCSACQMAVVWIENQLRENKTKELILQYANQVTKLTIYFASFSSSSSLPNFLDRICCIYIITGDRILPVCSSSMHQLCERLPSPNGESTVSCQEISKMPSLAFTIANKTFTLTPEQVLSCSPLIISCTQRRLTRYQNQTCMCSIPSSTL
jgi:hypothetical protein